MKVIKSEKVNYLKDSKSHQFNNLLIKVPKWWSIKEETKNSLTFYRADTRYDWTIEFLSNEDTVQEDYIDQKLIELVSSIELEFDEATTIIHSSKNNDFIVSRIEGTATQYEIERTYMDIYIVLDKSSHKYTSVISKSSILNGSVEGPYVEEVIKEVKKVEQA